MACDEGWYGLLAYRDSNDKGENRTHAITLGIVRIGTNRSFVKSSTVTPIVTKSSSHSFPMETGSQMTYSLTLTRVQPRNVDDDSMVTDDAMSLLGNESLKLKSALNDDEVRRVCEMQAKWSNRIWLEMLRTYVDRWQAKTNGCDLYLIPTDGAEMYLPRVSPVTVGKDPESDAEVYSVQRNRHHCRGYIKSMEVKYDSDLDSAVTVSMQFDIGTMYVDTGGGSGGGDVEVYLSNSDRSRWYPISKALGTLNEVNIMSSMEMVCGPLQPIPYVKIKINRNKLTSAYGVFREENAIMGGYNQVRIQGDGIDSMVGTVNGTPSISGSGRDAVLSFTAYDVANSLRDGSSADLSDISLTGGALDLIHRILEHGTGGAYNRNNTDARVHRNNFPTNSSKYRDCLTLDKNLSAWDALQLCAAYLHAVIFFCNNRCYVVDYADPNKYDNDGRGLEIHLSDLTAVPDNATQRTYPTTVGGVEIGSVSQDAMYNDVVVKGTLYRYDDGGVNKAGIADPGDYADGVYDRMSRMECKNVDVASGEKYENQYISRRVLTAFSSSLRVTDRTKWESENKKISTGSEFEYSYKYYNQPYVIARTICDYHSKSQTPITFTVREMAYDYDSCTRRYRRTYPIVTYAKSISDRINDITITAYDKKDALRPQSLMLSEWVRNWPEGTTTYTFGKIGNMDISSALSEIDSRRRAASVKRPRPVISAMTILARTYVPDRNVIRKGHSVYAGQSYDGLATRLQFTYEPYDWLEEGGWTPYIVFDVKDPYGDPYIYGGDTSPGFDGHDFDIPYEVTSGSRGNVVRYQLAFARWRDPGADGVPDPGSAGAEVRYSDMDALWVKQSVRQRDTILEPTVWGTMRFLRENAAVCLGATLRADGWTGDGPYVQAVLLPGAQRLGPDANVAAVPDDGDALTAEDCGVRCTGASEDTVTFTADRMPGADCRFVVIVNGLRREDAVFISWRVD